MKTEFTKKRFWLGGFDSDSVLMIDKQFVFDESLLKDHLIYGDQVLMGVAHLSLAINLAKKINPNTAIQLERISFSNPLILKANETSLVTIKLEEKAGKKHLNAYYSKNNAFELKQSAVMQLNQQDVRWQSETIHLDDCREKALSVESGFVFYHHPIQKCYGESLLNVHQVFRLSEGVVLGEIKVTSIMQPVLAEYYIHPCIFDACHVISSYALGALPAENHRVPLVIKKILISPNIHVDALQHCYCLAEKVMMNDQIAESNLKLIDAQGVLLVEINGFTVKTVPSQAALYASDKHEHQSSSPPVTTASTTLNGDSLEKNIQRYLQEKIAGAMGKSLKDIPTNITFMDLGLDSNNMIGAVRDIETEIQIELYPTLFFEYQNIASLSSYFAKENQQEFSRFLGLTDVGSSQTSEKEPAPTRQQFVDDNTSEDIAIIGMSGYLAQSENLQEFWEHLELSHDLIEEIPENHWDYRPWFSEDKNAENKTYSKWGSFIKDIDKFDPNFFGIAPRQADWIDPQLRLLLQSVQETFEDAGVSQSINGTKTGVYVGCCFHEYWDEIVRAQTTFVDYQAHSAAMSSLSGYVSYLYDLQGASIPLDNACASSLTALHLGVQAILHGECSQAVIAGVNVLLSPLHYVYFSRLQALSPTGRCYSFDKKADGYVPGEGVVSILIKPLQAAIRDKDNIHAVIKGTAINHVGRSNNPYSPRPELQTQLLQDAWRRTGTDPRRLSYLETHGTGTKLGDPIEINALKAAFKPFTQDKHFCAIGSAKAHIGHLEGAAGLTSLIKVVLMMKHKKIPRMPNFTELNPYIKLEDSPFYINHELIDWQSTDATPRLAGVSSFGMTGNNAHVIVEEYQTPAQHHQASIREIYLVPLSAKNKDRLVNYVKKLLMFMEANSCLLPSSTVPTTGDPSHARDNDSLNINDLAYSLQVGRQAMNERICFVVKNKVDLVQQLQLFLRGEPQSDCCYQGRVQHTEITAFFKSDNEARTAIGQWFKQNELSSIAALWVQGLSINWQNLYELDIPNRISLPTYPFLKERYWIPSTVPKQTTHQQLHPLVHENQSDFSETMFKSSFNGDEFFLSDHCVQGEPVLPGAVYLEMAHAAVLIGAKRPILMLKNIIWSQPIRIKHEEKDVKIRLLPATNDTEVRYEILTEDLNNTIVHSQGQLVFGESKGRANRDIKAILHRCSDRIDSPQIYDYFNGIGLHYGDSFQCIKTIHLNTEEVFAELSLPEHLTAHSECFSLHPSMMDAALQATVGFVLGHNGLGPSLPFAVNAVTIYAPTPKRGYAYVQRSTGHNNNLKLVKYDIEMLDEAGNVCILIKEFTTRALQVAKPNVETEPVIVSPEQSEPRPSGSGNSLQPNRALSIDATPSLIQSLESLLITSIGQILKVRAEDIPVQEEMSAYGFDSITLTEFMNVVNQQLNLELTPTIFFEYPTVDSFRDHLIQTHEEKLLAKFLLSEPTINHCESQPSESFESPESLHAVANGQDDIAIIGISGCFPMANDLDEFWQNLVLSRDCISEVPANRWNWQEIYGSPTEENKTNIKWGGFIQGIEEFDPLFFGISPIEAELMDPQQRLLLQYTWIAIEDAGYSPKSLWGSATGVFIGTAGTGYQQRVFSGEVSIAGFSATSVVPSIGPNRISYYLNLHGPSEPVETACSSSLVAIHRGVEALQNGTCRQVIVGGINTLLNPDVHISFSKAGMLSEDGRCKTFSKAANGYVRGEGVGILLMKRLTDALHDRDNIYAVIKATSINHGGRANSLTAPNANAQAMLLESAYQKANIDINTVTYIEAHGTGTALGDPVEVNGLKKAFEALYKRQHITSENHHCGIGSVKSNIGHLELAAGVAGVIKVLLAMKNGELPPTLHVDEVNPYIQLEQSPFYIVQKKQAWKRLQHASQDFIPRRAGVSSFGFGGVNAHVVLEEYCSAEMKRDVSSLQPFLIVLSAKTSERLKAYAIKLLRFLQNETHVIEHLVDLEFTLLVGREAMEYRVAFLVPDLLALSEHLRRYIDDKASELATIYQGKVEKNQPNIVTIDMNRSNKPRLAELWVRGGAIDWNLLYADTEAKRLSLPTYPFLQDMYWLSMPGEPRVSTDIDKSNPIETPTNLLYATPIWQEKNIDRQGELNTPQVRLVGLDGVDVLAAESIIETFLQAFDWVKGILHSKPQKNELLWFVVPDSYFFAPLAALIKTAQKENPKLQGKIIYLADNQTASEVIQLERQAHDEVMEVRYDKQLRRYVRQLTEVHLPAIRHIDTSKEGVYWITGGLGGLGLIFAHDLCQSNPITLILSGRSALDEKGQQTLEQLNALGARVHYLVVDVCKKEEVLKAYQQIRQQHGALKGIIHSAGLIHDAFILKKTHEEIIQVMQPKVIGLCNLDEVLQSEPLDFFIVFSSLAASVGSVGQADYAGGNAFMDAYVDYRNQLVQQGSRQGKTLSLNWPLWKEGGMQVSPETVQWMTRSSGLVPLSTENGLLAFASALKSEYTACLVMEGDVHVIRERLMLLPVQARISPLKRREHRIETRMQIASFLEETTHYLKKNLAKILKLSVQSIDEQAPMEKYGIDSVMVLALSNELEKIFGSLPKTLFFEYQTLAELASYFVDNHHDSLQRLLGLSEKNEQPVERVQNKIAPQAARKPRTNPSPSALDIAIIGISGRYPQAEDLEAFWSNLTASRDCITEIPLSRWDNQPYFDAGSLKSKWGGFIDGIDEFDPLFFNISPREAELMDPQERIFLQCAWSALEDSGYTRSQLNNEEIAGRVGVYVGVMYEEYQLCGIDSTRTGMPGGINGNPATIANRVSYVCNLKGPSMAVDTMCSSSLTTIYLACQSLQSGQCHMAIAGGVNVSIHPNKYVMLSKGNFVSSQGRCESFGQGGDGYVPGEGVGCVILKPLDMAIRDQDNIYGVIKGGAINHGGKTNGYTVPNPKAQTSVINEALDNAGIEARVISYVEAHGTGTSLGDPIEIAGLTRAYQSRTKDTQYCAIGSVKSNIGHCESAAGIAGLSKVLLQLKYQTLVPSIHSVTQNAAINFHDTPFKVQQELAPWERPIIDGQAHLRVAGISAFGAGGSNAHLIIEEYEMPVVSTGHYHSPLLIVLSAKTEARLDAYAARLMKFLSTTTVSLAEIAYTLQTGREAMEARVAFVVQSITELQALLQHFINKNTDDVEHIYRGKESDPALKTIATDPDFKTLLDTWVGRKKFNKLAEWWVKGIGIDWDRLYLDGRPNRVSLPTYPFAAEHYWIDRSSAQLHVQKLHPMLDNNISTLAAQQFTTRLSGDEFFLTDHQVQHQAVLPGVGYLEMAHAAMALSCSDPVTQLTDVVWIRPIVVQDEAIDITTSLYPNGSEVRFEIASQKQGIHSQGSLKTGVHVDSVVSKLNLDAIRQRCTLEFSKETIYSSFKERGLQYGPAFQSIDDLQVSHDEALANIRLPRMVVTNAANYVLHPSLMDAAIQAVAGFNVHKAESLALYLPFAIKSVQIYRSLPEQLYAYVRRCESEQGSDVVLNFDIDLVDPEGELCVRIERLSLRAIQLTSRTLPETVQVTEMIQDVSPLIINTRVFLKQKLAPVLKLSSERIANNTPLEQYGIDSVMVLELTTELEAYFGPLSKTLFFEYQTLDELATYFVSNHAHILTDKLKLQAFEPSSRGACDEGSPEVAQFSIQDMLSTAWEDRRVVTKNQRFIHDNQRVAQSDIAMIGISGRYPESPDLDAFWENLTAGRDCITEIPLSRWNYQPYFDNGSMKSKWGGFIEGVDEFDPLFFNISPRDAELMDPQERLFLQCAWSALEDSGYTRARLNHESIAGRVGVYVGVMYEEYQLYGQQALTKVSGNPSSIANRVSYVCNLNGPSIAIDTMCSSSLTAIHLACQSLRTGQCNMAIAGGVNISIHPNKYILLSQGNFVSSEGRCESFGKGGDGYVPGEGVGCVVLKPLELAIRDNDHIYGVIKGSAINHGGKTNGYTVPNPKAQANVITDALNDAGIHPRTISYVEAHGTGTSLGDPIEMNGLSRAYFAKTADKQYCAIGSAKSNIGHCESAAGIAGVSKVLLQLKHQQLVPSIHSQELNPDINFVETPFKVQQVLTPWERPVINGQAHSRIAGVSSFGAGGSNAHLIIEEYIADKAPKIQPMLPQLIIFSAKNEERLMALVMKFNHFLTHALDALDDIAFTLQTGREAMKYRLAFIVNDVEHLRHCLDEWIASQALNDGIYHGKLGDDHEVEKLNTDPDTQRLMAECIVSADLAQLAKWWSKGVVIDWDSLHQGRDVKRISLPTYPFAKHQYWIDTSGALPLPEVTNNKVSVDWLQLLRQHQGKRILMIESAPHQYQAMSDLFEKIDALLKNTDENWRPFQLMRLERNAEDAMRTRTVNPDVVFYFGKIGSNTRSEIETMFDMNRVEGVFITRDAEKIASVAPYTIIHLDKSIESHDEAAMVLNEWLKGAKKKCESAETSLYRLEKQWTLKPLTVKNTEKWLGNCLVLVNQDSLKLIHETFKSEIVSGQLIVESRLPHITVVEAEQIADGLLAQHKTIDYLLDLSDFYEVNHSQDVNQLGKIAFYQRLVGTFNPLTILYFTKNLQSIEVDALSLAGAKFAGLIKMLSAEYSHIHAKHIDVDVFSSSSEKILAYILQELSATLEETEIVYRKGRRMAPVMQARVMKQQAIFPLKKDGVYIITGGTNGVGLTIADYLVSRGVQKLVLMGVTPLPEQSTWADAVVSEASTSYIKEKLKRFLALERQGAQIHIYTGELTESNQLSTFFTNIRKTLGPISGVIHSAGAMQAIQQSQFAFVKKSIDDIAKVIAPKTIGTDLVYELLQHDKLDFFVSFSSTAGQIPSFMRGMSDYGMANAYLDYFSHYHQQQKTGTKFHTLAWVGWSETGSHMVDAEMGRISENNANKVGLCFNSNALGQLIFEYAMSDSGASTCCLPCVLDKETFLEKQQQFLFARKDTSKNTVSVASSATDIASNINISFETLKTHLQDELARILKVDRALITEHENFQEYGLDSISGTQFSIALEKYVGKDIQPRWLIEHPTTVLLAKKIMELQ